jgi:putative transposase
LLAERGIAVSYETVRRRVNHFGPMITAQLRTRRPKPHATWHATDTSSAHRSSGDRLRQGRAVDAEGEVLDVLVQSERNKHAALKLTRKLLKKYAFVPEQLVTDDLRLYGAAARALGLERLHQRGRWRNNRAENSHQRTDGGSARCNVSRALALRRNSSQPTPTFTTSSTSNAISYQLKRTVCFAPRR